MRHSVRIRIPESVLIRWNFPTFEAERRGMPLPHFPTPNGRKMPPCVFLRLQKSRSLQVEQCQIETISKEDLKNLFENEPPFLSVALGTLRWAETLQYVRADEDGCLHIDPVVARLLDLAEHDVKEGSEE